VTVWLLLAAVRVATLGSRNEFWVPHAHAHTSGCCCLSSWNVILWTKTPNFTKYHGLHTAQSGKGTGRLWVSV